MRLLFVVFAILAATISTAFGWGSTGHSVVAEIAQRRLSDKAVTGIAALIGKNVSLASISSWADDYKFAPGGGKTAAWHYIDLDIAIGNASIQDACETTDKGDCLDYALKREITALSDTTGSIPARAAALKFVVHLMGDLTQPLHCAERQGDGGGNGLKVDFVGNDPNGKPLVDADGQPVHWKGSFHALWDDTLIGDHVYSWGAYVDELENSVVPTLLPVSLGTSPTTYAYIDDWVRECSVVGKKVYGLLPAGAVSPVPLDSKFQKDAQPILDRQLAVGGLRLAAVLNSAFP